MDIAAILDRIEAGESVRSICDRPGWPTRNEFRQAVQADPALRASYDEARVRAIPVRTAIMAGHLPRAWAARRRNCALVRKPAGPKRPTKPATIRLTEAVVDAVIADVRRGTLLRDACGARGVLVPAFQFRALKDKNIRPRWIEAKAAGAAIRLARGTLRHVERILVLIESGASLRSALRSDPAFPDKSKFLNALDTDADLRARYDEAVAANRIQRTRRRRLRFLSDSTREDLRRRAVAALPKRLDADTRDDVAGAIVLAVLEGDVLPKNIGKEAKRFVTEHNRKFSVYKFASLDKSLTVDSTFSLHDVMTTW